MSKYKSLQLIFGKSEKEQVEGLRKTILGGSVEKDIKDIARRMKVKPSYLKKRGFVSVPGTISIKRFKKSNISEARELLSTQQFGHEMQSMLMRQYIEFTGTRLNKKVEKIITKPIISLIFPKQWPLSWIEKDPNSITQRELLEVLYHGLSKDDFFATKRILTDYWDICFDQLFKIICKKIKQYIDLGYRKVDDILPIYGLPKMNQCIQYMEDQNKLCWQTYANQLSQFDVNQTSGYWNNLFNITNKLKKEHQGKAQEKIQDTLKRDIFILLREVLDDGTFQIFDFNKMGSDKRSFVDLMYTGENQKWRAILFHPYDEKNLNYFLVSLHELTHWLSYYFIIKLIQMGIDPVKVIFYCRNRIIMEAFAMLTNAVNADPIWMVASLRQYGAQLAAFMIYERLFQVSREGQKFTKLNSKDFKEEFYQIYKDAYSKAGLYITKEEASRCILDSQTLIDGFWYSHAIYICVLLREIIADRNSEFNINQELLYRLMHEVVNCRQPFDIIEIARKEKSFCLQKLNSYH